MIFRQIVVIAIVVSGLVWSAIAAAGALSGGGEVRPERLYRIGFAQDNMNNDWRAAQVRDVANGLKNYPNLRFTYTDAGGNAARQVLDIQRLVRQGIDLLITSPADSVLLKPVLEGIFNAGTPVVLLDRAIDSDRYTLLITADNYAIAEQAGEYLAEQLGGRGRVVMLNGLEQVSVTRERRAGFMAALARYPEIQLVAEATANFLRNDAIQVVERWLRQGITFDAIYAHSDSMLSGARLALKRLRPREMLMSVGIDYIREAQQAIMSGEQGASFTYSTGGREVIPYLLAILAHQPVEQRVILPSVRVTRDNAACVAPIF